MLTNRKERRDTCALRKHYQYVERTIIFIYYLSLLGTVFKNNKYLLQSSELKARSCFQFRFRYLCKATNVMQCHDKFTLLLLLFFHYLKVRLFNEVIKVAMDFWITFMRQETYIQCNKGWKLLSYSDPNAMIYIGLCVCALLTPIQFTCDLFTWWQTYISNYTLRFTIGRSVGASSLSTLFQHKIKTFFIFNFVSFSKQREKKTKWLNCDIYAHTFN